MKTSSKVFIVLGLVAIITVLIFFTRPGRKDIQPADNSVVTNAATPGNSVDVRKPAVTENEENSIDASNSVQTTSGLLTLRVAPSFSTVLPSLADQKHALAMNEWFKQRGMISNHVAQQQ